MKPCEQQRNEEDRTNDCYFREASAERAAR
jgi:hypothetical protein